MPLTPVDPAPSKTDASYPAYFNNFFSTIFPNFVDELIKTVVGFNNGTFTGTSTTSHTINTTPGKVFVTQSGLSFLKGMWVVAISTATADTNNFMVCKVNAYSGTNLTLDPVSVGGSGTIASWRIVIVPPASAAVTKSEVRYETGAGYGTINTFIRNFTTAAINTGSAVTGALSTTNGASFTINSTGVYAVTYQEAAATGAMYISKNAASLIAGPVVAERLAGLVSSGTVTINYIGTLTAGDVIRAHPGSTGMTSTAGSYFQIVKLDIG